MLYIFDVDAGQMTTYDMNLTLQSVATLKAAIERKTKIPAGLLVLLVSGGEVLLSDHMVSSYSAGTDSNPIYMFSKPSIRESHLKQSMCSDLSPIPELEPEFRSDGRTVYDGKSLAELRAAVEKCCSMPPTVQTVLHCTNLAQQFSDLAHEVCQSCEQLVHEQHLQFQGWSAVVANLDDIFNEFCERSRNFKESFRKQRLKKEEYHESLNALNEVLEALGKIPMLPALQQNAQAHRFSAFDVFEDTEFEGHHYGVSQRLDGSEKTYQDFGVEALKLSEEDVFEHKEILLRKEHVQSSDSEQNIGDSSEGVTLRAPCCDSKEDSTLLHWILAQGNKASLQDILDYCQKGLALIDVEPLKEHEDQLCHNLQYANHHGLKQITGIENRLYGLDQLLIEVRDLRKDQANQAASLIQYRDRLNSACDPSVLPTLVQSHWCQLEKLLKGHQTLVDRRKRISNSKDELCQVLKARLEFVLKLENSMSVQDAHAMLSFQCFNRLERYFGIVSQLYRAPSVFVRAVHEVVRRRTFSQAHVTWATDLAAKLLTIHNEEVKRRENFNAIFEGHFLKSLFPGMSEMPPTFGIQAPPPFDARLPLLTDEDVEFINNTFPQLTADMPNYDMDSIVKFFQQRLQVSEHNEKENVETDLDKDTESEAEAGDFEKLSRQSSQKQKMDTSTLCVAETMAVSTITEVRVLPVLSEVVDSRPEFEDSDFYIEESLPSSLEWGRQERQDNMEVHKINIHKLQDFLVKLCALCRANLVFIKEELSNLKRDAQIQREFLHNEYLQIVEAYDKSNAEIALRHREQTQRLTVDHELELSDMKATLTQKDDVIELLKKEKEDLKIVHGKEIERLQAEHLSTKELLEQTRYEIATFEKKLEEIEAQKQKAIKEVQEKMHLEYKGEIESMRSRFRLVALTNMDRSPSESSLEKIERTDVIEISSHNAIVMQTKENAEIEKEEAVKDAVTRLEAEWKQKLETELAQMKSKFETEKQVTIRDVTRSLLSHKDRLLESAREREQILSRECSKYRDTIQQLTDPETNDYDSLLKAQFATLENDKAVLQQQILELKKELERKSDDSERSKEEDSDSKSLHRKEESRRWKVRSHTPLGMTPGTLCLTACAPGSNVLVLWDPSHHNYTVMQEAAVMYFVHSDSLPALELSIHVNNESERKLYTIGTVETKEFCYAKKTGNRYGMPRNTKFYRVRVRPMVQQLPAPACCDPKPKQDTHANSVADSIKCSVLSVLPAQRPLMKWLNYMHAKDSQKSVDNSQSTSSATDEANRIGEVVTGTLIDLESPVGTREAPAKSSASEDQLDSIETGDHWQPSRMQMSTATVDMECSVGRVCPEPLELTVSAVAVVSRGPAPPGSELAQEASP